MVYMFYAKFMVYPVYVLCISSHHASLWDRVQWSSPGRPGSSTKRPRPCSRVAVTMTWSRCVTSSSTVTTLCGTTQQHSHSHKTRSSRVLVTPLRTRVPLAAEREGDRPVTTWTKAGPWLRRRRSGGQHFQRMWSHWSTKQRRCTKWATRTRRSPAWQGNTGIHRITDFVMVNVIHRLWTVF